MEEARGSARVSVSIGIISQLKPDSNLTIPRQWKANLLNL